MGQRTDDALWLKDKAACRQLVMGVAFSRCWDQAACGESQNVGLPFFLRVVV